jgi:hypothetical protein
VRRLAAYGGRAGRVAALALVGAIAARSLGAQAPGLPVLQDAFYGRGAALGINAAGGGGVSTIGLAASYAPLAGRLVIVAGGGVVRTDSVSQATGGFRIAFRVRSFGALQQLALAAFAGGGATEHAGVRVARAPFGISLGYRRPLGITRALAAYAAPYYDATRVTAADSVIRGSRIRTAVGVDLAVTPKIGFGAGADFGGAGVAGTPLAAKSSFGAGLSYRF